LVFLGETGDNSRLVGFSATVQFHFYGKPVLHPIVLGVCDTMPCVLGCLTNCKSRSRMRKRRCSGMIHDICRFRGYPHEEERMLCRNISWTAVCDRVRAWDGREAVGYPSYPQMSPPTRFGCHLSNAAGEETDRVKMQSRKSGAKRVIWRLIDSV
jgi:hypothetical protein